MISIVCHTGSLHLNDGSFHPADDPAHLVQLGIRAYAPHMDAVCQFCFRQQKQLLHFCQCKAITFERLDLCQRRQLAACIIAVSVFTHMRGAQQPHCIIIAQAACRNMRQIGKFADGIHAVFLLFRPFPGTGTYGPVL